MHETKSEDEDSASKMAHFMKKMMRRSKDLDKKEVKMFQYPKKTSNQKGKTKPKSNVHLNKRERNEEEDTQSHMKWLLS